MKVDVQSLQCRGAQMAASLRHSWLEGKLVNKTEEDILRLWRIGPWEALENEFPSRLRTAHELANSLGKLFSPAQLVDQLQPIADLDQSKRDAIGRAVHEIFRKSFPEEALSGELKVAIDELEEAMNCLRSLWGRDSDSGEGDVLNAWHKVHASATRLLELLRKLPEGVVLP